MTLVANPILRGCHPDAAVCQRGDDYYVVTSTFEWYPGIMLYHTRDLINYRLVARPLTQDLGLDLRGESPSAGIWAPDLTWANGKFWLIFTDVKSHIGPYKNMHNYLICAEKIEGPWSPPVYLNSSGFDPALFHDEDGRKYLLNMLWDDRVRRRAFAGILIQEWDAGQQRLIGQRRVLFSGSSIGVTEGAHLYKREGWYYLFCAEGGTGSSHAGTVARSESLDGPWEIHPDNPLITSKPWPQHPLQSAGHPTLCEYGGRSYIFHICNRTLPNEKGSPLGRETCLQELEWRNGWPYLLHCGNDPYQGAMPALYVDVPGTARQVAAMDIEDNFDGPLSHIWHTLRGPLSEEQASLCARPGWLRLKGREALNSHFSPALLACRIRDLTFTASTRIGFYPDNFQQVAGLAAFFSSENWASLQISHEREQGRVLTLVLCQHNVRSEPLQAHPLPASGAISLLLWMDGKSFGFAWRNGDDLPWNSLPWRGESRTLSDFFATTQSSWGFSGCFIALHSHDMSGMDESADFNYFHYSPGADGTWHQEVVGDRE